MRLMTTPRMRLRVNDAGSLVGDFFVSAACTILSVGGGCVHVHRVYALAWDVVVQWVTIYNTRFGRESSLLQHTHLTALGSTFGNGK